MGGTDVSGAEGVPTHRVAKLLEVSQHLVEPEGQVPSDVLEYAQAGTQYRDGLRDVGPQVAVIVDPLAAPCVTEWLAGEAAGDDVDRLHGGPVDLGHVAVVGDVRPVVGEHLGRGLVELDEPRGVHVEDGREGEFDPAVSGEEAASGEHQAPSRPT